MIAHRCCKRSRPFKKVRIQLEVERQESDATIWSAAVVRLGLLQCEHMAEILQGLRASVQVLVALRSREAQQQVHLL